MQKNSETLRHMINIVIKYILYIDAACCFKHIIINIHFSNLRKVGCRYKTNCSHVGGMPSVRVFLRDPSPCLRKFRRKHRKAKSTSATEDWTRHLPPTSSGAEPLIHWWGKSTKGCFLSKMIRVPLSYFIPLSYLNDNWKMKRTIKSTSANFILLIPNV